MFKRCYSSQKTLKFGTIKSNMATMQKRPGRLRRFFGWFGWFGRHKVLAVLVVLVLGAGAYWFVSGLILGVRARHESDQYNQLATDIIQIENAVAKVRSPKAEYANYCVHSNFGGVFEADTISCYTEIKAVYTSVGREDAKTIGQETKNLLIGRGLALKANLDPNNIFSVTSYNFLDHNTRCHFDVFYYDVDTMPTDRDLSAPSTGVAALTDIICGGRAKRDYFPVAK